MGIKNTNDKNLIEEDIMAFLARHESKELLRFVTIGSVDDGKSTLIGRLLYDTENVFEDQLESIKTIDADGNESLDLANITDGLMAEREQGITIDVAYRYFNTEKRKFIIADTPGHIQYTRNMATGASTAELGIILIDARLGVLQQSRRHAYIASLLGISHLLVAVNKMDIKDWAEDTYMAIQTEFLEFAKSLNFQSVTCIPISALEGDNVVDRSENMPWYDGETVLERLESVPIYKAEHNTGSVLPVQYVIRPDLNFRGYAGTMSSGVIKVGDVLNVLPSGKSSTVKECFVGGEALQSVHAPQSVTITLNDEIDISRGDVLAGSDHGLHVSRKIRAEVVWMDEQALRQGRQYIIKQTTRSVTGAITEVHHRLDMDTLAEANAHQQLNMNDIGSVTITLNRPLVTDLYGNNRDAGSFIIIDMLTNITVGAGMITDHGADLDVEDVEAFQKISANEKAHRHGQVPSVVWITGRHGIGKMPIAYHLGRRLFEAGHLAYVLDPPRFPEIPVPTRGADFDNLLSHVDLCLDMGAIAICGATVPNLSERQRARKHARKHIRSDAFIEVHLEADVEICRQRLLDDGRTGDLADIDYEEPKESADIVVDASQLSKDDIKNAVDKIMAELLERQII